MAVVKHLQELYHRSNQGVCSQSKPDLYTGREQVALGCDIFPMQLWKCRLSISHYFLILTDLEDISAIYLRVKNCNKKKSCKKFFSTCFFVLPCTFERDLAPKS